MRRDPVGECIRDEVVAGGAGMNPILHQRRTEVVGVASLEKRFANGPNQKDSDPGRASLNSIVLMMESSMAAGDHPDMQDITGTGSVHREDSPRQNRASPRTRK